MAPGAARLHLRRRRGEPVDRLGIEPEVEALCWVIAARDTVPPLSVGLFGDWGSGKTTFMALMQARIRDLAEQSRTRPESPWCGNVMQISFNAWTYADDNLWASLVTDIFTALAAPARYEPEDKDGDPVGMLATIAQRRHAAETRRQQAAARIEVAEQRLEQLPDSSGELAREVLVGAPAPGGEPPAMADADFVKDVRKAAGEALGDDAAKAVDDAVLSVGVLATLLARLRAFGPHAHRARARSATARSRSSRSPCCSWPRSSRSACSGSRSWPRSPPWPASPARSSRCSTPRRR